MSVKLIVSDFDQVLALLAEAHYVALNQALATISETFCINEEEQTARFEGRSTKDKLSILVQERGFPKDKIDEVFRIKQELTAQAIENTVSYDALLFSAFSRLKEEGFLLYVASNAIRDTLIAGLTKLGILHLFDKVISNEDVIHPKPHPQIYLQAMVSAGVSPDETLILEDSKRGAKLRFVRKLTFWILIVQKTRPMKTSRKLLRERIKK